MDFVPVKSNDTHGHAVHQHTHKVALLKSTNMSTPLNTLTMLWDTQAMGAGMVTMQE